MMLQFNDEGVLEKVDEEKLVTVDETELQELIDRHNELQQFKDKVFEVIDSHILEETEKTLDRVTKGVIQLQMSLSILQNDLDKLKMELKK